MLRPNLGPKRDLLTEQSPTQHIVVLSGGLFYNVFAVRVLLWRSVDEAAREGGKFVDTAVAEERPPAAYVFAALQVDVDQVDAFTLGVGAEEEFALRTGHKGATPKLDAVGLAAGIGFVPDAVDGDDGQTVGDGVTALHCRPRFALTLLFGGDVATLITDGGGVDEEFCAAERHEASALGIPLIPADLYAETADAGVDGLETEVAGGEVEFLIVGGIVGDVHLAIFAGDGAVALKDHGGVVVEPRCAALKEGGDEHYGVAACEFAEKLGRRAGNRFGEVEKIGVFRLTEIGGVVQFLQHHEFGSALGGGGDVFGESVAVLCGIRHTRHLDEGNFHCAKSFFGRERMGDSGGSTV